MIIIKVELLSANTGQTTELARMHICNDETGTFSSRNYIATTYKGRSKEALNKGILSKVGRIIAWQSERYHIWNLVRQALTTLGYTQGQANG